jgi:hypothetical protein
MNWRKVAQVLNLPMFRRIARKWQPGHQCNVSRLPWGELPGEMIAPFPFFRVVKIKSAVIS